jgi:hypothetical protein
MRYWKTYPAIEALNCFKTLNAIAAYPYDATTAKAMKTLCFPYNSQRNENYSFCDDECNNTSDALCKL